MALNAIITVTMLEYNLYADFPVQISHSETRSHIWLCILLYIFTVSAVSIYRKEIVKMDHVQNKIDIIRKLLDKIEEENSLTKLFQCINSDSRKDFKDFSPEQIYFDLIKQIIDQNDLPENVHYLNIFMDTNDQILRYELVSWAGEMLEGDDSINIIWDE